MRAAGWGTPLHWLAAQRTDGDAQLVVAFSVRGAIDVRDTAALQDALRAYAPEAEILATHTHDWNADPNACGGWATTPVGWESAGIVERLAAPHGRILLAGSDVAPVHAGWMAGAIASGRQQAQATLDRLGAAA
jgi:monoamine oxidase